jgi:uncharacterized protein YciI
MPMTQYLFMMIGRPAAPDAEDTVTKDYNAKWMAWIGDLAARGALRGGGPLEAAGKVVTREEVTDLKLETLDVGAYLVVEAESMEAATAIAQSSPGTEIGATTIVRPCVPIG